MLVACKTKFFSVEVLIAFNPDLLAISEVIVASEHINFVNFGKFENGPSHGPWILPLARRGDLVGFLDIGDSIAHVHNHPALGLRILDHDLAAPFEETISAVGPWHLLVGLDVLAQGLREGKHLTCLLCIVVRLLNCIQLHVFIPIAHARLVGILWAAL